MRSAKRQVGLSVVMFLMLAAAAAAAENWLQLKFDSRHSGNVPDRSVTLPLGLAGAVPLTDAVFTAPVVKNGHVYVVDGAGVAFDIDAATLRVVWKRPRACTGLGSWGSGQRSCTAQIPRRSGSSS